MSIQRRIENYRSAVLLAVIVGVSLVSLGSGARAGFVGRGIHGAVMMTSRPFLKLLKETQDGAKYVVGLLVSYNRLTVELEQLRRGAGDMTKAAADRRELDEENARLRRLLSFVREAPRLTLEPAEVIERFKGTLKIDRGSVHGIEASMGVVTPEGIVGIVTEVDRWSATVLTLDNGNCRIAAMIERNRVRGSVRGSGSDLSSLCTMEYIDMKDEVWEGDAVVTSPESVFPSASPVFPSGFPIGRVVGVDKTGSLWKAAYIEPIAAPYRLDEVLVVRRSVAPVTELEGRQDTSESGVLPGVPAPDNRPLQERYAP